VSRQPSKNLRGWDRDPVQREKGEEERRKEGQRGKEEGREREEVGV
jgi:hypothetical protein